MNKILLYLSIGKHILAIFHFFINKEDRSRRCKTVNRKRKSYKIDQGLKEGIINNYITISLQKGSRHYKNYDSLTCVIFCLLTFSHWKI